MAFGQVLVEARRRHHHPQQAAQRGVVQHQPHRLFQQFAPFRVRNHRRHLVARSGVFKDEISEKIRLG